MTKQVTQVLLLIRLDALALHKFIKYEQLYYFVPNYKGGGGGVGGGGVGGGGSNKMPHMVF